MSQLDISCRTIKGARRYQEDAAALWPGQATYPHRVVLPAPHDDRTLLVLADGMGGHAGGAIASITICEAFLAAMSGSLDPTEGMRGADTNHVQIATAAHAEGDASQVQARMMRALELCNTAVNENVKDDPALEGMGATLIGAEITAAGLMWISVGDSPMYLCRRDEIAQLNEDHSLAPMLDRLAADGMMSRAEALSDSRRHVLRSVVMGDDPPLIDLAAKPLALAAGDVVILASDGIHTIEPDEIARIATGYFPDGSGPIADALLRAVENQRAPHQDNTTVIVVRVVSD